MGSCAAAPPPTTVVTTAEKMRNIELSTRLDRERQDDRELKRLLFLGTTASGKSTFMKQIIENYGEGFNDEQKSWYKRKAALNILEALDTLAEEALEMPQHDGVSRIDEAFHNDLKAVQDIWTTALSEADDDRKQEDVVWDEQQAATIESLWNHPSIQHAFENRGRFPFDFGDIEYFFKRLEHLSDPKYVFSVEDITYVRSKTSGVYETKVMVKDCEMIFIDVAGQRSSRKKWISCFSDVTAVIWVSALDNYDQVLFENQSINAMDDALEAFEWAVGHPELEDAVFALFLNKIDLLEKKVANDHFGLKHFFHDYNGEDQNIEHAAEFLKRVFLNCVPDGVHVPAFSVQATDATNANKVLDSVIFGLMSKTVATAF